MEKKYYVVSLSNLFSINSGLHKAYSTVEAALKEADPNQHYIHVVTVTTHDVIAIPALGPAL